jgi:hypothetical protein
VAPYYPTTTVGASSAYYPSGTGYPLVPEASSVGTGLPSGTGYPMVPVASGTAAPTGTGAYSAPLSQFTGAASGLKVGSALAGVGAVAALLL